MRLVSLYYLTAALGFIATRVSAQKAKLVEELFVVDFSTDARGGCRSFGRERIDTWLKESLTLTEVGINLVDEYIKVSRINSRKEVRLFHALFGGSRRYDPIGLLFEVSKQATLNHSARSRRSNRGT